MNTQKQIEALETKLAEVSAELQRLKGQKAGRRSSKRFWKKGYSEQTHQK